LIEQRVTEASVDKWRSRFKAHVRDDGGHFEHELTDRINIVNYTPFTRENVHEAYMKHS